MKKIGILGILGILMFALLMAQNSQSNSSNVSENNESNRSCDSVEVSGCFDSNFMSKLLTTVCEKGKMEACYNLGIMYAKGEGIRKNKSKAIVLFKKACDGGIEDACTNYEILTTCEE